MRGPERGPAAVDSLRRVRESVRRAFAEFLAVPTWTITAFLALAGLVYALDRNTPSWLEPARAFLEQHVFLDSETTRDLLAAVAGGVITVASITFSVLLLAVQQAAASMSNAVLDQFLRRRQNQLSFGFFTGLALYALVTLATVHQGSNAVLGATVTFLLTVAALYVLLILLYSTVDQMRPSVVVGSIRELALEARERQLSLVRQTRRHPAAASPAALPTCSVRADHGGYVTRIDLRHLERALFDQDAGLEVALNVSVGCFVGPGDEIARIRVNGDRRARPLDRSEAADQVRGAIHLERDRDLVLDPAFAVEQIATIGWTSISSAKSNPAPGRVAIHALRDLLARWAAQSDGDAACRQPSIAEGEEDSTARPTARRALPVVYRDTTVARLFDALESLGVAAAESMQHQSLAEVFRTVEVLLPRFGATERLRAVRLVKRLLPSLSHHVRTTELDESLAALASRAAEAGEHDLADSIRAVRSSGDSGGHQ